ncbi:NACHT domain-containing protein [Sphingobacterium siyangense]|uniref:NACHT domain-containing protein n=1 Tax=Sphingobacterium siyangense TaxID=459529 RepID=UPI003DA6C14B
MDLETVKGVATIAAPFSKIVLDTFLAPKLQSFKDRWKRDDKITELYFENKFLEYLTDTYEKNGILNTVAFKKKKVLLSDVYIPLTLQCEEDNETPKKKVCIQIVGFQKELFSRSNKILITDTAGMGKSTLLKKMLISAIEQNIGVPILIELRRLSKEKDIVDEILEQLNPINEQLDRQFILDLIKRGDFIFFFDGFDEISLTDRANVTSQIQSFISKAKKNRFVLTSRPEEALSSFGDFHKFQIKPLITDEAFTLIRKYDSEGKISNLLINKIKEEDTLKNIKEYLTTPLLVSLLFTAFEYKQQVPFKKHIFYRQVYDALFESHDLSKGDSFEREKNSKLGSDEFHRVLRIFGYLCLTQENKIEFTRDELGSIVTKAIQYCPDLNSPANNFIKDLIITVPIFTKDGIYYKWSHKSLQEYFAAQYIYLDAKEKQQIILNHIAFHQENSSFLNVIDLYRSIDPIGFENVVVYRLLKEYDNFIKNSYANFSGCEKTERQQNSYGLHLFLINFPFKPRTKNNHPREIFDLIKEKLPDIKLRMSIQMADVNEEKVSFIKIPEILKPQQVLIEYLFKVGVDYISRNKFKYNNNISVDLKLPLKKVEQVSDRKNSILNKAENFGKTNLLIRNFFSRRSLKVIDNDKYEQKLLELQARIETQLKDELLNF